ncbi:proprotein convertase subtilisin/kexin type 5-like [Mercenaria mercenaria]|uniref:proprotein convertase subtilisin/kexin type 5-like n=1 Tax=Mercenaria mercenaria TaxID=6596 RepID=UPI00234FA062|nr:proprotein convertase subtilisin/kexin type 5-like [Mercenaria mercenaria]
MSRNWRTLDQHHCTTECPAVRLFKQMKTISNLLHYVCIDKCPSFEDNGFCVNKCPENKVIFNFSCLINCPSSNPILLSNECISECPLTAISTGPFNSPCIFQCNGDKPFVSYNKCVHQCPEIAKLKIYKDGLKICIDKCEKGSYTHNGYCVNICPASTFAVNSSCINSCPTEQSISCMVKSGHLCGTEPHDHLDHKICVDVCPENMFILNRSCVYSCPHGMPSFNKECTDICPVDNPYLHNSTIERCSTSDECNEIRYLLKCIDKCPNDTYLYNKVCMLHCPNNTFYNGYTCVEQCPPSKNHEQMSRLTYSTWKIQHNQWYSFRRVKNSVDIFKCVSTCSSEMLKFNSKCLRSCPEDYHFVRNRTCTRNKCDTRFTYRNVSGIFCTESCETFDFELNGTCVKNCPDSYFILNKSCEEKCPGSHPYSFKSICGKSCKEYSGNYALREIITCVSECPNNSYVYNYICSSFCPKPLFTYRNECIQTCPESSKFINMSFIKTTSWTRHQLESHNRKTPVKMCVSACPDNKAAVDLTCEATCPVHSRFIYNGFCTNGPCNTTLMFHSSAGIVCTNICPTDRFEYNKTCVLHCPLSYFSLKQRCIKECDIGQIVNNETIAINPQSCSYGNAQCTMNFLYDIQCRHDCPGNKFLWNGTCLDVCPVSTRTFNKTCVLKCPYTHQYISQNNVKVTVWRQHYYYDGYLYRQTEEDNGIKECVKSCSKFKSGYDCVDKCTSPRSYLFDNSCVSSCPDGTLADLRGHTCVEKCPNDMVKHGHTCRIICGKNQLYKNNTCVKFYECIDPMFEFAGDCLQYCPDDYVWFVSCVNKVAVGVFIPVLSITTISLVIFGRHTLIDFFTITWLICKTENKIKEYLLKKPRKQADKRRNSTLRRDEKVLILEDMDSSDEDLSFKRTKSSIHDGEAETVL